MKAELAELSALKINLETATRNLNNQFVRLTERLDRIERAETESIRNSLISLKPSIDLRRTEGPR